MRGVWLLGILLSLVELPHARAEMQFDVFLGYGEAEVGVVREANWFPICVEVYNDGPPIQGVIEVSTDRNKDNTRRLAVELPTNTRKRLFIPDFGTGGRYMSWDVKLLDANGKLIAEQPGLRPKADVAWNAHLLGAMSRTFPGTPRFPEVDDRKRDQQPVVVRILPSTFPDTPIALEALDSIYLHSERALELEVAQINALMAWLHAGGHLIVAVGSVSDISGTPWLANLLPCDVSGMKSATSGGEYLQYIRRGSSADGNSPFPWRNVDAIPSFEGKEYPLAELTNISGDTELSLPDGPAIVSALRGRGKVTVLAFDPEREPFRTWDHRTWLFRHVAQVPGHLYLKQGNQNYGGQSLDGVFGGMVDSKQVRKLPVHWLLLLLVVYLLVIGPFDQYFLKKINKQMLTWITFPCYVVLFSLLIYLIGFALRAGETEWNELHVVDIIPDGDKAQLHGRTYASVYSPQNARYELKGKQPMATLRGEFMGGSLGAGQVSSRATVDQTGDGYAATIFVPVWTSQLFVSDWWQPGAMPLTLKATKRGVNYEVTLANRLSDDLSKVCVAVGGKVYTLEPLAAGEERKVVLSAGSGRSLSDFLAEHGKQFYDIAERRRQAFGSSEPARFHDVPMAAMATTFTSELKEDENNFISYRSTFISSAQFDLVGQGTGDRALVLAWLPGETLTEPMNQFKPQHHNKDTLLRLSVPIQ